MSAQKESTGKKGRLQFPTVDRYRQNRATQKGQKSKKWPSPGVISIKEYQCKSKSQTSLHLNIKQWY